MSTRSTRSTRVASALALGVAALALARRTRSIAAVSPELRTSLLWVPLSVGSRAELALGRRLFGAQGTTAVQEVSVTPLQLPGGQGARLYEPQGRKSPSGALLWIHGGGFVLGQAEVDEQLCSQMARDLGIVVLSASYRLAPEHPFPAAVDDCTAALRYLHAQAGAWGVDPARIAVGGASAGGGLAASVVQRACDEQVQVCFQLLVYPMLDDRTAARRGHDGRGRVGWTPRSNRWAWSAYLGHGVHQDERRPYAVPSRRADLRGLPPAYISVGELDLFHDEDVAYARRLQAAGVPVQLHVEPGMYHGAESGLHTSVPTMRAFRQRSFDALAQALGPAGRTPGS